MIVGDKGREAGGSGEYFEIKISTLNDFMKILFAGRKRGVDASQRRHVGDLFPLPGPTPGYGGISCTPQSRSKVACLLLQSCAMFLAVT